METSKLIVNRIQRPIERSSVRRFDAGGKVKSGGFFKVEDKVELSGLSQEERLAAIKKRVASGFYNSGAVKADVSEKLTNVFDELLQ